MAPLKHLHVEFFTEPVEDVAATRAAGVPKFKDEEFVRIRFVGDNKRELVAPAHYASKRHPETRLPWTYAEQYPEHYKAFKDKVELHEGTPLAELPFLTASKRKELEALNIHTGETLAELNDAGIQKLGMGGRDLVNKAKDWLDTIAGFSPVGRLEEQNSAMASEIDRLKEQIAALQNRQAVPVEPEAPQEGAADDEYAHYGVDDLKAIIKQATGRAPSGTPKREDLIEKVKELVAEAKEKEAA